MDNKIIKGCYLASKNMEICKKQENGIYEKIISQYHVFEKKYNMCFISESWKTSIIRKVSARLPFFPNDFGVKNCMVPKDVDFVFFRFDLGDMQTINFLNKVKKNNPNCKIIVEVPTYPLAWPTLKWFTKILLPKHKHCEARIKNVADICVCYDRRETLYGLPALCLSNGIDTSKYKIRDITSIDTKDIHIFSVSSMARGYGLDRIIAGIINYYKAGGKRNVFFHIVGYGATYELCKKMIKDGNVEQNIILYGYRTGNELDSIENNCDLSVDMLGGHRNNNNFSSTLKSRRSWAKGMPIITSAEYSSEVDSINDYICRFDSNDSPIDVNKIIDFYDDIFGGGLSSQKNKVAYILRQFAIDNYSFEKAMSPIFAYIEDEK